MGSTSNFTWPYPDSDDHVRLWEHLQALAQSIDTTLAAHLSAASTYTPAWTASAGAPSIGSGTLSGRYKVVGKWVDLAFRLVGAGDTNYGTAGAYWMFGLPPGHTAAGVASAYAKIVDSTVTEHLGGAFINAGGTTIELFKSPSGRVVTNSPINPFGTADSVEFSIRYEIV